MKPETVSTLLAQLNEVPRSPRLICIDGPAGSGKTTLASRLAEHLRAGGVTVGLVHMDDLYEGWDLAFDESLAERIGACIITPLRHGLSVMHPVYDWSAGRYATWAAVPPCDVLMLEGVGAARREVRAHASWTAWVHAPADVRWERLMRRDGEAMRDRLVQFVERERAHHLRDGTEGAVDMVVAGQDPAATSA